MDLIDLGAIPHDRVTSDLAGNVKAIVPSHGHLEHIGTITNLAHGYDAPLIAMPFAIELVRDAIDE